MMKLMRERGCPKCDCEAVSFLLIILEIDNLKNQLFNIRYHSPSPFSLSKMALIMKYIDSMHHYMDKYGGK